MSFDSQLEATNGAPAFLLFFYRKRTDIPSFDDFVERIESSIHATINYEPSKAVKYINMNNEDIHKEALKIANERYEEFIKAKIEISKYAFDRTRIDLIKKKVEEDPNFIRWV